MKIEQLDLESLLKEQEEIQKRIIERAKKESKPDEKLTGMIDKLNKDVQTLSEIIDNNQKELFGLRKIVNEKPKEVVKKIKINELPPIDVNSEHKNFTDLLVSVSCDLNVMLVGEAGSGKSTAAYRVAKSLKSPFYSMSVGSHTSKFEFFGYTDANGKFVETDFYKAYTKGGIFLIDEIDAGNPGVLTSINSALANKTCSFANGMQEVHPKFICIATANTYGKGATTQYVGRLKMDETTRDRFVIIDWNIDEELETKISTDKEWCKEVQGIRKAVQELKLNHLVTTRAVLSGEKLLSAGLSKTKVLDMTVFKGLKPQDIKQIKSKIK